jgi:hypothetical protein
VVQTTGKKSGGAGDEKGGLPVSSIFLHHIHEFLKQIIGVMGARGAED